MAVSLDEISQYVTYRRDDAIFFWKSRTPEMFKGLNPEKCCSYWNSRYAGKEAFVSLDDKGYRRGRFLGRSYRAHRTVWLFEKGVWPKYGIDHIDGDITNNHIDNLRDAPQSVNMANRRQSCNNTSGFTGVYWAPKRKRWYAQVRKGGKLKHIGYFNCFLKAAIARKDANAELGFSDRHGL